MVIVDFSNKGMALSSPMKSVMNVFIYAVLDNLVILVGFEGDCRSFSLHSYATITVMNIQ